MAKKQKVKDYYAAGIHWIAGGLAIPLVISVVFSFFFGLFFYKADPLLATTIVSVILPALAVWLGVYYSARFILKRYSFEHPSAVVRMSTIYFAAVSLLMFLGELLAVYIGDENSIDWLAQIVNIIDVFVFYWASKRYIRK